MAVWKDIDIFLGKKQDGDILDMEEIDAVKNSLRNIMSTMTGQRRMLPTFALPLYEILFQPMDEETARDIGQLILKAILDWEDRVEVSNVNVWPNYDQHRYDVTLSFSIKTTGQTDTFDYILKAM